MDRKVKNLILAIMALTIFVSCEPDDVDGPPPGDWYYQFVNGTSHDVKIICSDGALEKGTELIDSVYLAPQDSITRKAKSVGFGYGPFEISLVHLVFDDTLFYLCSPLKHSNVYAEMVMATSNYECIQNGPDVYHYRYEITEKEYEYAKAHSFKYDKEVEFDNRPACYRIVNNTKHDIRIELDYGRADKTINLAAQDSVTQPRVLTGFGYNMPFSSLWTHLVFDDSLYYLCDALNHERGYAEMIIEPNNYELISDAQDTSLYRYEITEKDYEYAKAHPYKYE